jgi:hypothetical protein
MSIATIQALYTSTEGNADILRDLTLAYTDASGAPRTRLLDTLGPAAVVTVGAAIDAKTISFPTDIDAAFAAVFVANAAYPSDPTWATMTGAQKVTQWQLANDAGMICGFPGASGRNGKGTLVRTSQYE